MSATPQSLRQALRERVVVADGAMGTMLQAHNPTLDDFQGYEGCNEILNVTRPDIVRAVHKVVKQLNSYTVSIHIKQQSCDISKFTESCGQPP